MEEKQEKVYRDAVLRAHNITQDGSLFCCNDGDMFPNAWEALDHTIWLDLMSKRIHPIPITEPDRDCRDYYEIINERPSNESIEEDEKAAKEAALSSTDSKSVVSEGATK